MDSPTLQPWLDALWGLMMCARRCGPTKGEPCGCQVPAGGIQCDVCGQPRLRRSARDDDDTDNATDDDDSDDDDSDDSDDSDDDACPG